MKIILATRKSPLALVQAEMVAARLRDAIPGAECELLKIVTTGDKQAEWSLSKQGGKGLFTAELEQALLRGEADVAVHSCKDLPGEMVAGLVVAGYLPREDVRDVLVLREGVTTPATIATGSPRRQMQLKRLFPTATFTEIRGNVDTRLKKIAAGTADATILARAGLNRLGIHSWAGVTFRPLNLDESVPAVGQGAIAIQSRLGDAASFSAVLDAATARNVTVERALQAALGGGCQMAFGAHVAGDKLYFFHEKTGIRTLPLADADYAAPAATAARVLQELSLP
ncbi:MAG TPA: hydroxymethylbilane synthase [Lacunisphaera sp.]|jgi:hydroxymethylbilane synthase|nr:hydroxymethylbilane synthase [Lacunisphaera sp.]HQY05418.1 hydroxymethylbilane synthase [Lacunisphaera sp.]